MTEQLKQQRDVTDEMNIWRQNKVVKKDFWLIPIYIITYTIIPTMLFLFLYIIMLTLNMKNEALISTNTITILGGLLAEIIILLSFYAFHHKEGIAYIGIKRFKNVTRYILLIIATYMFIIILSPIYEWLITFLPKALQYGVTENQKEINGMFKEKWLLPLVFLDIVILTPMIEELLFRHLIIHELGKKITYSLAAMLSVILFASIHVLGATSPFEIGGYIIIATGLVFVYLKSGMNLAVSISLHALINFISFIATIVFK
ncbi:MULTISPECIES: CPBP family intramembrane glutamic endopeptidase [Staphylococcus]|uniref:CPBP family intramembrane metalloprotease n=2 Tax=Staphylococcus succinus TaxID=61015 RepID=A0ABX5IK85_9STAP|nr:MULTISPECIES: type II CAAX endopeptidase family protein [Staphylococcus]MDH9160177.1 type II CAAX endopeptidase family protein [Staphylococcus succinus]MEB8123438.1 CPBP family intramembrane metalloprotease [Staphylococcus succinus]OIJ31032.1 CAAX protease family protein [Staphylococcus sp. LCT-H4]PNZ17610.1 CPBP family intramembrane metalloprotease [Staphylococcus succinus subsp. succinus]PTI67531.1 CPBP family intramembrane metalloprotease [Staphylococcus succinus]